MSKKNGGDDPTGKRLEKTNIPNPVNEEMESRKFAFGKDNNDDASVFRSTLKKEYESKDKDLRNALDKGSMRARINRLEDRERKMGGEKAVTSKIKRKEKLKKALPYVAGGLVLTGVAKMAYDEIQRQKKVEK
jgi:hypothetical protein